MARRNENDTKKNADPVAETPKQEETQPVVAAPEQPQVEPAATADQPAQEAPKPELPIDSIRNQPTDEELAARRASRKPAKETYVQVRTTSGGDMWDPQAGSWITGQRGLALQTEWLDRQIAAKKIETME